MSFTGSSVAVKLCCCIEIVEIKRSADVKLWYTLLLAFQIFLTTATLTVFSKTFYKRLLFFCTFLNYCIFFKNKPKLDPDALDLELFGFWQTDVYIPPPAVDVGCGPSVLDSLPYFRFFFYKMYISKEFAIIVVIFWSKISSSNMCRLINLTQ